MVPDLGQPVGATAEHRHQLAQRQVAGDARRGTRRRRPSTSRNSSAISVLGRPVADAHRVEPGVAERQRQVALRRDALVRPAAEPVEPVAERRQGAGDVAVLAPRERAPERVIGRGSRGPTASIASATIASTRFGQLELPAPAWRRGRRRRARRRASVIACAVAAQEPEDARRRRRPRARAPSVSSSLEPGGGPPDRRRAGPGSVDGSLGGDARRSRRRPRGRRGTRASAFSAAIRAASASSAEALEGRTDLARPRRARGSARGVASRARVLIRLISVSQSRAAASSCVRVWPRPRPPSGTRLGRVLGVVDGARVGLPRRRRPRPLRARRRLRWARRRASSAASAWARARVASSQRSSARRRSSAHGPWRPGRSTAHRSGRRRSRAGIDARAARPRSAAATRSAVAVAGAGGRCRRDGGRRRAGQSAAGVAASGEPVAAALAERTEDRVVAARDRDRRPARASGPAASLGRDAGQRQRRLHDPAGHRSRPDRARPGSPRRRAPECGGSARRSDGAIRYRTVVRRSAVRRTIAGARPGAGRPGRRGPVPGRAATNASSARVDGSAGDRVVRDGQADLVRRGWPSTKELDEGGAGDHAEDQAQGQEAELARGHAARISGSCSSALCGTPPASVAASVSGVNLSRPVSAGGTLGPSPTALAEGRIVHERGADGRFRRVGDRADPPFAPES